MSTDFIGAGWNFPLGFTPSGGFDLVSGTEKLEQSVRLILSTYPGERPMRPEFGSRLRDFVFRDASPDTATELAAEVRRALRRWEPRIEVADVLTYPDPDRSELLYLDVFYRVRATNDERNLVFPFYIIPEGGG